MSHVRSHDLKRFSEALEQLYSLVTLVDFAPRLFAVIEQLIPDTVISLDEVNTQTGELRHARNFAMRNPAEWMSRLSVNLERDHPGIAYVRAGGTEPILQLGDWLTQRQLRETALYQENYKEPGIAYQVAVVLPIPNTIAGLAINRGSRFRERDLTLIRLLRPHVLRAHANARRLTSLEGQIEMTTSTPDQAATTRSALTSLTAREMEVFHWLAQGKRDREIAVILDASHRTIQKHVQKILEKLGVENRGAAATYAKR